MKLETIAGLDSYWSHGTDRDGGGDGPVILLLHGFGVPGLELPLYGEDLLLPGKMRLLCVCSNDEVKIPDSLVRVGGLLWEPQLRLQDSRGWWPVPMDGLEKLLRERLRVDRRTRTPEGMQAATEKVRAVIDQLVARGIGTDSIIVGGHSQGAQLATNVVLQSDKRFMGMLLMSTTYLAQGEWLPAMPKLKDIPVLVSHGRTDPILPFDVSKDFADDLANAGARLRWHLHEGGHETYNTSTREQITRFLLEIVSDPEAEAKLPARLEEWQLTGTLRTLAFVDSALQASSLPDAPPVRRPHLAACLSKTSSG